MVAQIINTAGTKRTEHPYLAGNFAPVSDTHTLTACEYDGTLPSSLADGQYVRNGANPLLNEDLGRDAHWFDGDGMLTGVLFKKNEDGSISPQFVNNWIETDMFKAAQELMERDQKKGSQSWMTKQPIPPSIATLINPTATLFSVLWAIMRTVLIVLISHLPYSPIHTKIKRISAANTAIYYHDGRALATCESGPPMTIDLPELQTEGWFDGRTEDNDEAFGGKGFNSFFREWTTGHPKVDIDTGEMLLFHNTTNPPFVQYSVVPSEGRMLSHPHIMNKPVPGIKSPKMMHDFGCSAAHTVIMDLPLSLNPLNLALGKPVVAYEPSKPARFGVFPRHHPDKVQWFEDEPCIIFHTAATWDEVDEDGNTTAVCMLACRMSSANVVFVAANLDLPAASTESKWQHPDEAGPSSRPGYQRNSSTFSSKHPYEKLPALEAAVEITVADDLDDERTPLISRPLEQAAPNPLDTPTLDQCRLHYYRFPIPGHSSHPRSSPRPSDSFPLSAIPLEFPTTAPGKHLREAQYVYACSTSEDHFSAALGKASKIDVLAKMNTPQLVRSANPRRPQRGYTTHERSVKQILAEQEQGLVSADIQLFKFPAGWYGQEARFVPNGNSTRLNEDDGHLLFFAFDEGQLDSNGTAPEWARSELWILDARNMRDVVAKIKLVQRVPYGLHGEWFDSEMIRGQRCRRKEEKKRLVRSAEQDSDV